MSCDKESDKCYNPQDNKRVVATYTPESILPTQSSGLFNIYYFQKAIEEKGYDVEHEKALRCACVLEGNEHARSDCKNCGGVGWIFIDKTLTKMLVSRMGKKISYDKEWTQHDATGMATFTTLPDYSISYMDRITLICSELIFNETIHVKKYKGNFFSFFTYMPTDIESIYVYQSSNKPLLLLKDEDYEIKKNILILNKEKFSNFDTNNGISVRYKHRPQYHVTDIVRENSQSPIQNVTRDGLIENIKQNMPLYCIGKKPHYLLDPPNFDGEYLFDNSNYENINNNDCNDQG